MRLRNKILIAIATVLVVGTVIPVIQHYQLKAAVNRYRAELKAKGEPMELVQVIPPSAPAERNGAELFLKVEALLQQDKTFLNSNYIPAMQIVSPGKAVVSFQQPEVRAFGEFGFTTTWEDAKWAIGQNQEVLTLLQQILNRPEIDFHIRYDLGFVDSGFFTNSHLIAFKKVVRCLRNAAVYALHEGDADLAAKDVKNSLILVSALQNQRTIIAELVSIAMTAIAQEATWEVLQSTNVTGPPLAMLQDCWARLDFLQSYQDDLNMERIIGDMEMARYRSSNRELKKLTDLYDKAYGNMNGVQYEEPPLLKRVKNSGQIFLWRYWWSYTDELQCLKGYGALMAAARLAKNTDFFMSAIKQQETTLSQLGFGPMDDWFTSLLGGEVNFRCLRSDSIPMLGKTLKKAMQAECSKRMTVTAIALRRAKLKHGRLPEILSKLTPEFLISTPLDPVDGKPLRYQLHPDGKFLLYSIGENNKDDGGDARPLTDSNFKSWQSGRDWVWPQPATKAEIEKHSTKQSKSLH